MYLAIHEDGTLQCVKELTSDVKASVNNGYLDLIRYKDGAFEFWYQDVWHKIKEQVEL